MKITNFKEWGFTLVEIMIVVAIVGLLSTIAIPSFVKSRHKTQSTTCINQLRLIDGAIQQWAMENGKTQGAPVNASDCAPYLGRRGNGEDVYCVLAGYAAGVSCNGFTIVAVGTSPEDLRYDPDTHPAKLD